MHLNHLNFHFQWQIQDFPEEGALTPKGGAPTYYLANFSQKLHKNEEILGQRGGTRPSHPPLDPPLILSDSLMSNYIDNMCCNVYFLLVIFQIWELG